MLKISEFHLTSYSVQGNLYNLSCFTHAKFWEAFPAKGIPIRL